MQEMNALKIQYTNETKAIDDQCNYKTIAFEKRISPIETNADNNKVEKRDSDVDLLKEALVFKSKELEVQLNNMTQMRMKWMNRYAK